MAVYKTQGNCKLLLILHGILSSFVFITSSSSYRHRMTFSYSLLFLLLLLLFNFFSISNHSMDASVVLNSDADFCPLFFFLSFFLFFSNNRYSIGRFANACLISNNLFVILVIILVNTSVLSVTLYFFSGFKKSFK